jgi:two-component system phosphate regulon sensor histidine kinase PhoR
MLPMSLQTDNDLDRLAALIKRERSSVLEAWRAKVRQLPSAKHLDTPRLDDHMPRLIDEISKLFDTHSRESIMDALRVSSPPEHGLQREAEGFDVEEVVAEYNLLRGCIHDLADRHGIPLQGEPFHILNEVLDCAIGLAVQTFATQQALEVQRRREEYLAFVMHDLRTPLNAIALAASGLDTALAQGQQASDKQAQLLRALRRNVNHLAALIARVIEENANLQTEVGVSLERREFDLWPFVESLIHDLHPVAGTSSTELLNEVPDELVVYADASLLRRVFQNLIANAIRYTPRGTIVIGARSLDDSNHTVECWVRDDGSGIPAGLRERIFDKGESGVAPGGGSGLGLVIVKTFIEAHGGTVSVASTQGQGSTFRMTLPGKRAVEIR